jgi:hypothetical protein
MTNRVVSPAKLRPRLCPGVRCRQSSLTVNFVGIKLGSLAG